MTSKQRAEHPFAGQNTQQQREKIQEIVPQVFKQVTNRSCYSLIMDTVKVRIRGSPDQPRSIYRPHGRGEEPLKLAPQTSTFQGHKNDRKGKLLGLVQVK